MKTNISYMAIEESFNNQDGDNMDKLLGKDRQRQHPLTPQQKQLEKQHKLWACLFVWRRTYFSQGLSGLSS